MWSITVITLLVMCIHYGQGYGDVDCNVDQSTEWQKEATDCMSKSIPKGLTGKEAECCYKFTFYSCAIDIAQVGYIQLLFVHKLIMQ